MRKKYQIGDIVKASGTKHYYVVFKTTSDLMGYACDEMGSASKKIFIKLLADTKLRYIGSISLKRCGRQIDDITYSYSKPTEKDLNIKLSLFDSRYIAFTNHAPGKLQEEFSELENANYHFQSAQLVHDFFNNPKKYEKDLTVYRQSISS